MPGYNTVDATLWCVLAIRSYVDATGDRSIADELLPVLCDILEWHVRGTRYGIGVDAADGLLRAGEMGVQLTWMDARVGDRVVTPRRGKPVEIQALWYNALRTVAEFLGERVECDYSGNPARRDSAYHQGPVWTWLICAYVEALWHLTGDRTAALDLLRPFEHHLRDAGLGSLSEILEGDASHLPCGATAQAWGVAEVLLAWRALE